MQSAKARGADREIITEEIDRALRNIDLRLQREHEGVALAAGPQGGEYWRFLTSVTCGLPESAGVRVVANEGSVANAFLIESRQARAALLRAIVGRGGPFRESMTPRLVAAATIRGGARFTRRPPGRSPLETG
jgi:hypothetical protein